MAELTIYYEDEDVIIVRKPAGVDSQESRGLGADMVSMIRNYLAGKRELSTKLSTGAAPPYVAVIHRLDRQVAGVMVYAKNRQAAAALSAQLSNGHFSKIYLAAVCGKPVDNSGTMVDYLLKDGKANLSRVVDKETKGAKKASLAYEVLGTINDPAADSGPISLVRIRLYTGRHHQIRVQFASRNLPLWGDPKYNPAFRNTRGVVPALTATGLTFDLPKDGRTVTYRVPAEGWIFDRFREKGILKE